MGPQSAPTIDDLHVFPPWAAFIGRPFCYCARHHPHLGVLNIVNMPSASTESHIHLGNDDPDLVSIVRGMGTEDRGRALAYENRPNLYRNPYFNDLISHNIDSNREVVVYADD